eukprot:2813101-Rhodomonas_salina.4
MGCKQAQRRWEGGQRWSAHCVRSAEARSDHRQAEKAGLTADGSRAMNDLHVFDPQLMTWEDLSGSTPSSIPPSPRFRLGMTAAGGLIYVFGGEELTEDLEGRWISEWGHGDTL